MNRVADRDCSSRNDDDGDTEMRSFMKKTRRFSQVKS